MAFSSRGAKEFISWDRPVSASHTDTATLTLLEHMVRGDLSAVDAVRATMDEVGADPVFKSRLAHFESQR